MGNTLVQPTKTECLQSSLLVPLLANPAFHPGYMQLSHRSLPPQPPSLSLSQGQA